MLRASIKRQPPKGILTSFLMEGVVYAIDANFPAQEGQEEEQEQIGPQEEGPVEPEEPEEAEGPEEAEEPEEADEPEEPEEDEEAQEEEGDYEYEEGEVLEQDVGDRAEVRVLRKKIQQMHRRNSMLLPFLCNICVGYVRNGVITICGHLFCWSCLWAALYNRSHARCPHCKRRLLLHEDIMPFLGEGPTAGPNDSSILAQPGNVPRPSGLYLENESFPEWFAMNGDQEASSEPERKLAKVFQQMHTDYPRCMKSYKILQWMQLITVLLMIFYWMTMIAFE